MEQLNLFSGDQSNAFGSGNSSAPLAERMKPKTLDDFVGQLNIMEKGGLRKMIEQDALSSIILYGPPGTGKTSLARIVAASTKSHFITLNAVSAGIKDIKAAAAKGEENLALYGKKTVLFIDEVHRFNKLQQDALLPYVEAGQLVMIGATTENPYFEVNSALISRSMVFRLEKLGEDDIVKILKRAIDSEKGLKLFSVVADDDVLRLIARAADGDARRALTVLGNAVSLKSSLAGEVVIEEEDVIGARKLGFANKADNHYDLASAFIKSMRGSDADAAVFYLALLIESGEDPAFIARRIVIAASEDVGNADPQALVVANAAAQAALLVGLPEARIILSQAATYVASAPKSNAAYLAIDRAIMDIKSGVSTAVPHYLKDGTAQFLEKKYGASSQKVIDEKSMSEDEGMSFENQNKNSENQLTSSGKLDNKTTKLGISQEYYKYPHDYENGYVAQQYLPYELGSRAYYEPKNIGFEKEIKTRIEKLRGSDE